MTEPNPRHSNLASVIYDMEDDVCGIGRWADVLMAVGTATHFIPPEAIYAIAHSLKDVSDSLREQYYRAHALSHPKAEQEGSANE